MQKTRLFVPFSPSNLNYSELPFTAYLNSKTSSSSSNVMADFGDEACWYDVFLSFCGQDTRNSFADHLYQGLNRAGIRTFRDNEGINKGERLKPEIERAIKDSRASVVILSKNYANSTWCLDELLLILEQRRDFNHFVLPVFYGVEPTDVRNQQGAFAIKAEGDSKWTDDKVNKWKTALTEVADLAGHVLSGLETNFLKNIVYTIYSKLDEKDVGLPPNITGMNTRYEVIKSWLRQSNLEFLAIYGMGGSGKTTLAKYIYRTNQKEFESVSFLEDIGHTCKRPNGLLAVQEQLLKDISGEKWKNVPGVSRGQFMIGKHLQMNRALIVLDGIVGYGQLVDLLGTGRINAHSKIVITTRENPDKWFRLSCWRCQKYEMRLLNDNESLELLSTHAFGSKIPMLGYEELIPHAIQYCEGNPLALQVLGSSMFKNITIENCRSQLNLLEKQIDSRIHDVLVRSYVSLPSDTVKELFLHIACFFIGKDMDYAVKILEPDFSAISGVETLVNACLLSVSPNKTLMMHRLHQEMGKNMVFQESTKFPSKRSRIWLSSDSYNILSLGEGSKKVEGFAIDMKMLQNEAFTFPTSELTTDALKNMDSLKLLQLNFVELSGSYERFSKHLRWLCWHGFHLATIPSDLYMGNLVAIDMSYSNLEVFEPHMVLRSLRILNLKDSYNLFEIRSIFKIPHLETLILWNCYSLVDVCRSIGDLTSLALLNLTGCKNLFRHTNVSTSGGVDTKQPTFSFPRSLRQLFLKDCHVICTDSFPLSFSVQPDLQYLNLGNSLFEFLPCYNGIESLRVLDLSFCSRLKRLLCLPSTLAELYISYCESLERITFQSPQFNLQEFRYEGCIHLYEIEGFFKLVPVDNLDEADLGHLQWLKEYQKYEMCLVGDDELTVGRSWHIQMLYEFGIISTSLPNIVDPNMKPKYISKSSTLSFDVPSSPGKSLKGINVTFKYAISGEDWAWFCKISTANGDVDLMYNPKVFGKLESGEVCIWLSYWPIGNKLSIGDTVNVSIVVLSGLEVHECGVSLVYSDQETVKTNMGWAEVVGGDLSRFQLSTGAYYLCRKDFFELVEVGRLTLDWFRLLVGGIIDYTEIRGWRNTGQAKLVNQSYSELKTIRHIIHDPQLGDTCNMAKMSKSSFGDKTVALTSDTKSELIDETMVEIYDKQYKSGDFISTFDETTMEQSDPYSYKIVLAVNLSSKAKMQKMLHALSVLQGIESINYDKKEEKLTVIGVVDPETLISHARKIADINFSSVVPASEMSGDNTVEVTSGTGSELIDEIMDEIYEKHYSSSDETIGNFISASDEMTMDEYDRYSRVGRHARQHERRMDSATEEGENSSLSTSTHLFRSFSLTEIISATKNFDDELIIGKGGYGTVYKGQMAADLVAVKRLHPMSSSLGELEFRTEINILSTLRHRHLVPLVGYCHENKEMILVFKFISKGTLYHHLHNDNTPLSWLTRLKIAIGAARGLDYLHTGVSTSYGVIHRDVKSRNILLDASWEAVISDFGISIICPTNQSISYVETSVKGTYGTNESISSGDTTHVRGTFGYLDPEYLRTVKVKMETDVYAFGVVLFELLSGRLAVDPRKEDDQSLLITWAQKCVKERKLDELVDPNIKGTISTKCLKKFAQMAACCVHSVPKDRPTMTELVASLQALLELQEKSDRSAQSSGIIGLPRKISKYLVTSCNLTKLRPKWNKFPKEPLTTTRSSSKMNK